MFYFYSNLSINSAPILYHIKQLWKHIINDRKIIVAIVKYKHKFFRLNPICQWYFFAKSGFDFFQLHLLKRLLTLRHFVIPYIFTYVFSNTFQITLRNGEVFTEFEFLTVPSFFNQLLCSLRINCWQQRYWQSLGTIFIRCKCIDWRTTAAEILSKPFKLAIFGITPLPSEIIAS